MQVNVNHLMKRGNTYYFRAKVPVNLRESFGCREIKRSLKTDDLHKAQLTCKLLYSNMYKLFNVGKEEVLDRKIILERVSKYVVDSLQQSEEAMAVYGKVSQCTRATAIKRRKYVVDKCKQSLLENDLEYFTAKDTAKNLLSDLDASEGDICLAAREVLKGLIFVSERVIARFKGKLDNEYDKVDYLEIYRQLEAGRSSFEAPVEEPVEVLTVSQLFERYATEKVNSKSWLPKMERSVRNIVDILVEHFGDVDIRSIKHQNLLDFRDNVMLKIPSNWKVIPALKDLPLAEVLEKYDGPTQKPKTINTKLVKLNGFFIWCLKHEYIDKNPAGNLSLQVHVRPHEERKEYSKEDIEKLLSLLPGLNAWKPYKYWIPIIALLSGARQAEIAQMYVSDIVTVNGVPCFDIKEEGEDDKSIKSTAGYRIIPIHPTLIQLGFLNYVNELRRKKKKRLWENLKKGRDGYGQQFQRFYGRFNRRYITDDKQKVFHSLRHNFTNNLKQHGVEESKIAELVGHSVASITLSRYGKPYEPQVLLESLKLLDYGIDIFELVGETPISDKITDKEIKLLPVSEKST